LKNATKFAELHFLPDDLSGEY